MGRLTIVLKDGSKAKNYYGIDNEDFEYICESKDMYDYMHIKGDTIVTKDIEVIIYGDD